LRYRAIRVWCTIGVDAVWAVVLLVRFAVDAVQISADLSSHAYTIPNLNRGDLVADSNCASDNFMAYAKRKWDIFTPTAVDGVNIGCAHTTSVNGNVNVVRLKGLEFDLESTRL